MRFCCWCGARESGLGIHSDPEAYPKFSCEIIHSEFGRVCPKRKKHGPRTLAWYEASKHRAKMLKYISQTMLEVLSDNMILFDRAKEMACGVPDMKIGSTIQIRKPALYIQKS